MKPDIIEYPTRDGLADAVAQLVAERLRGLVASIGRARLAVPGGTTPGAMLTRLGSVPLPWSSVVVTTTDERCVPADSREANQHLLAETLFRGAAAEAMFVPLFDGSDGAEAINASLERNVLPLDIVVLGMGADMHTASLFPGAAGLDEALADDAPAAVAVRPAGIAQPRITLSARVLREAGERHVLITGTDKRESLERASAIDDPRTAPICAVLQDATVHYAA